ncbi:DUF4328 domain-containing protein [Myxococcus llanfairpwllgwyngyllgogerychwyrndrobwllllantysiliogogogochensis]|nr:DUF4328 domain-containing protein [Myxococcus llanfairpwllgwyngyllgogerychwyrndrobwllllantysiliogogogochensis]
MLTKSDSPPVDAACVQHPDQLAAGTCIRCGSFVCEKCQERDARACSFCRASLRQRPLPSSTPWAIVATCGIGLQAVAELAHIAVRIWVFSFVQAIGYTRTEAISIYAMSITAVSIAKAVIWLLSAVYFLTWQYRAVRIAGLIDVSQASPRWAILSWFVPGMNLFKPYQILRDLWLDLGGAASRTTLIRAWWCIGLLTLTLGVWNQSMVLLGEIVGISFDALRRTQIAQSAMFLLATVLCVGVVVRIQRRLVQLKAEVLRAP